MEALRSAGAENVTVFVDSMLVVRQISKEWEVREDRLKLYWEYLSTILLSINQCRFVHLPREENQLADVLATLASMWQSNEKTLAKPLILAKSRISCYEEIRVMPVGSDEKPWYHDLQTNLETSQFPENADKKERLFMKMLSTRVFLAHNGIRLLQICEEVP